MRIAPRERCTSCHHRMPCHFCKPIMLMRERSCAGVVWCEGFNETRSVRVGSYGPSSLYRSAHEHAHACASPHLTSHLHLWLKGAHKASLSVQPHLTSPRLHPVPLCAHSNVRHFAVLRSLKKKKIFRAIHLSCISSCYRVSIRGPHCASQVQAARLCGGAGAVRSGLEIGPVEHGLRAEQGCGEIGG
jgi:hypothetical protein